MLMIIPEEKSAASHRFRSKFEVSNGEVHESHFRNPAHNRMSKSWNPNLQNRITIIYNHHNYTSTNSNKSKPYMKPNCEPCFG